MEEGVYVLATTQIVEAGTELTSDLITTRLTMRGAVPANALLEEERDSTIGLYAKDTIYPEDFINSSKLIDNPFPLAAGQQYIAIPAQSLANVLAGQLKAGDIVSVYVFVKPNSTSSIPANSAMQNGSQGTILYPELTYLEVVMQTNSRTQDIDTIRNNQGQSNSLSENNVVPSTVILKAWDRQAQMLVDYTNLGSLHIAYRGNTKLNPELLTTQKKMLESNVIVNPAEGG